MHKYTLHPDDPDFIRAKMNAQQISDVRHIYQLNTCKIFFKNPLKKDDNISDI